MTQNPKIAFLGTGLMGYPMARNLAQSGRPVTAWNRSASKAAGLSAFGVSLAKSAHDAIAGADIIISILSDGSAVTQVASSDPVQQALKPGALWIDMSSTQPQEAKDLLQILDSVAVGFLDAPVSGGSKGADQASLAIMVGGEATAFERAHPVLSDLGRPTLVGPTGAGQLAKLANQSIVAITIAAVAEATLLLEQRGADPAAVRQALKGGFADSTILQQHGQRMSDRNFEPGGPSYLQLKDLDNVLTEAESLELPTVQHVRDRYARYIEALEGGNKDHAGLYQELRDRNNLPLD
ncbi:MAG: NAD(P)-dependent oxidoreductase [Thalassovita sp.]